MRNLTAFTILSLLVFAVPALGAPGLPITKPPVGPVPSWTGPSIDPHAIQGQWIQSLTGGESNYPYEFHDNVYDDANKYGGGWKSYLAIEGYAKNIVYSGGNIISFDIDATITNDKPALSPWLDGNNTHGEEANNRVQHLCNMLDTKLTASFAIGAVTPPVDPNGVYVDITPHIVAINHDSLAWYCWTPDNDPNITPHGGYWVPTWSFGDIQHDESATRLLSFTVDGAGLDPNDSRFTAIVESYEYHYDLLSNRTTSLKISDWLDTLSLDLGVPYPTAPAHGSDVSVFFIPEPATLVLLALGGLAILRRRR